MKVSIGTQGKRTAVGVAIATALGLFATGSAQAATFANVDFSIVTRASETQEVAPGDLLCSWRETGLGPYQVVTYNCAAGAVAAVEACVYKGKVISDTQTITAQNVSSAGEHGGEGATFIANNGGRISGSTAIAVPEAEGGGEQELCPELGETGGEGGQQPEVQVVAVRWCNLSLTDSLGTPPATQSEVFAQLVRGTFTVPSCTEILPAQ